MTEPTQGVLAQVRKHALPPDTAIFTHDATDGAYVWNVSAALALLQTSPRPAYLVSPQLLHQTLRTATVDHAQVAKADPHQAGLVACYFDGPRTTGGGS